MNCFIKEKSTTIADYTDYVVGTSETSPNHSMAGPYFYPHVTPPKGYRELETRDLEILEYINPVDWKKVRRRIEDKLRKSYKRDIYILSKLLEIPLR